MSEDQAYSSALVNLVFRKLTTDPDNNSGKVKGDRVGGDRAGLIAAALLATNYVYVMYDRAAIMEALMAAFIVASWYCSTRAERQPAWGAPAGLMATLAGPRVLLVSPPTMLTSNRPAARFRPR